MKKAKKGKTQLALAVMVVALAAAIGLNMKYSSNDTDKADTSSKYLGQAEYVNAEVENQNKSEENQYFKTLRSDRNKTREEALDVLEELIGKTELTTEEKKSATDKAAALAAAAEKEAAIETVLKAKGFKNVLVVIGEKDVNVIIDAALDTAKTQQVRDAVMSKTDFTAADIKIIASNENS
ncbi:MAG: SpoIIIAH-like family protein [Clostridia bacterium]|nr:SpoIIIAH-like family protein [Clostridia bacterium]